MLGAQGSTILWLAVGTVTEQPHTDMYSYSHLQPCQSRKHSCDFVQNISTNLYIIIYHSGKVFVKRIQCLYLYCHKFELIRLIGISICVYPFSNPQVTGMS